MSEENKGYFPAIPVWGVPVFLHHTLPLYALVFLAAVGFKLDAALAGFVSFMLVLAVHEFGHVVAIRHFGLKVHALYLTFGGGKCMMEHAEKVRQSAIIYSAGMLAQLALMLPALGYWLVYGVPEAAAGRILVMMLTVANGILLVMSLYPHRLTSRLSSDGLVLWRLYRHVYYNEPHPYPRPVVASAEQSPVFAPGTRLLSVPGLVPPGFACGIEILNDSTTPMDFVVTVLRRHVELNEEAALAMMLDIHNNGGVLVPLPDMEKAEQVAAAIAAEARAQGHAFTCRAVDVSRPGGVQIP